MNAAQIFAVAHAAQDSYFAAFYALDRLVRLSDPDYPHSQLAIHSSADFLVHWRRAEVLAGMVIYGAHSDVSLSIPWNEP